MWNIFGGAVTNFNWIAIKYVMEFSTSSEIPFFTFFMEFNYPKITKPQRGDILLFTTKSQVVFGTHLIVLGRMKAWVDLEATQWFQTRDPRINH